ncbi:MAG: hypothetical protein IJF92_02055 [Bacilli bacterium]|nr:hypothetical protein [Bacilli bacterium]
MRKNILLVLIFTCVLFLTGCNGTVTRELRESGFNLGTDNLVCTDLIPKKEGEVVSEKIRYINDNLAITDSGKIYELSYDQKFSNNENCRKVNTSFKVSAIMNDDVVRGEDNKFYYLSSDSGTNAYSEITVNDDSYEIYNLVLSSSEVKKVSTVDESKGIYYVLLTDGNVYKYVVDRSNYDSPYTIVSKTIAYNEDSYGKIIDFNYDSSNKDKTYVKTDDVIYRMQVTNKDKCDKYADVECKYKFMKDEVLTKYYKTKILYYGPTILITTYGRTFN